MATDGPDPTASPSRESDGKVGEDGVVEDKWVQEIQYCRERILHSAYHVPFQMRVLATLSDRIPPPLPLHRVTGPGLTRCAAQRKG